jgi:hypothetical protein
MASSSSARRAAVTSSPGCQRPERRSHPGTQPWRGSPAVNTVMTQLPGRLHSRLPQLKMASSR